MSKSFHAASGLALALALAVPVGAHAASQPEPQTPPSEVPMPAPPPVETPPMETPPIDPAPPAVAPPTAGSATIDAMQRRPVPGTVPNTGPFAGLPPPQPPQEVYPPCSATLRDQCTQTYERGMAKPPRASRRRG
jgi:hypothetical protein